MGAVTRFLGNLRIWPGPILAVELVTTSRRTRYFVLRVIYAAALFFALWFTHQETLGSSSGDINSIARFTAAFFGAFGVMQLMAVLLIGPALAAGTIAQERERRTMEYLYATPLSNLEIVIGKLGGRVLQILYLVLSGVPVLALAMLLGGIAPWAIAVADGHHPEHGPLRDDGFHRRVGLDRQGPRRNHPGVPRFLLPLGAPLSALWPVGPSPVPSGSVPLWNNSSSPTRSWPSG